jgi:hypothetical protein
VIENNELRLFHTGIVVDDLDAAMSVWGGALGLHWAPPKSASTPMECPSGVVGREVRFTYSLEGPHHIELLEQIDAGPYLAVTGGRYIHHLGYWTRDLAGQSQRLEELGFHRELSGLTADGRIDRAVYHRNPLAPGMWVEVVDENLVADIEGWMAAAAADQGVPFRSPFG